MKEKKLSWFERLLIWRAMVKCGQGAGHNLNAEVADAFASAWIALKNHRVE